MMYPPPTLSLRNALIRWHSRILCVAAFLVGAVSILCAAEAPPEFLWARKAGGGAGDECSGLSVATDRAGNCYVSGFFTGTTTFGGTNLAATGLEDAFVAKYDPAGNLLWARKAGGAGYDEGRAIVVDGTGNVIVAGLFQGTASFGTTNLTSSGESDVFLARFSPAGMLLWARKAGGNGFDEALGLAVDAAGDAYLTGYFTDTAVFGGITLTSLSGSNQFFVAKCSSSANFLWARRAGGTEDAIGIALAVDAGTNTYVTGSFAGNISFGSTNLVATGTPPASDIFIARYDSAGSLVWVRQAGGTGTDYGAAICVDSFGNVGVAGRIVGMAAFGSTNVTAQGADIFIAKYSGAGNLFWVRKAGGNNSIYGDAGLGVQSDGTTNFLISGYFSGNASFGGTNISTSGFNDIFVGKYDGAGNLVWVRKAGGADIDIANALALDPLGNVFLAGFFAGTATFGNTNLVSGGGGTARDIFVARIASGMAPRLTIDRTNTNTVVISWPAAASDFLLESTVSLSSPMWTTVIAPTNIIGQDRVVSLPSSGARGFFRLRR